MEPLEASVAAYSAAAIVEANGNVGSLPRAGSVGRNISIGRVMIRHRDLVVGDVDGVVVAAERMAVTLAAGEALERKDAEVMAALDAGATTIDLYRLVSPAVNPLQ